MERRQVCWAHLRRDFQAMIDPQGGVARVGENLLLLSDAGFRDWHRVRDGTLRRKTFASRAENWYRPDLQAVLQEEASCGCVKTATYPPRERAHRR
jgi:transposase